MIIRQLADLKRTEIRERISLESIIIQPIGAIEQHGPHLPLNVDTLIAESVTEALVTEHGDSLDLWMLPTQAVGKSTEHEWSPGTLSYSTSTLLSVLADIGRSIAATYARKLVFVNGHGGNSALLSVACREIRHQTGLMTFLTHPFLPPDQGGASPLSELGMGIHAGRDETSLMLHLRPELVDMSKAERRVPEWLADNRYVRFGGPVSFGWLSDDFGDEGTIGDPTGANAQEGQKLFQRSVTVLAEQLTEIATFRLPDRIGKISSP